MLPNQNGRIMSKLASCHKALPVAILLALLVCGQSQTSSAQSSSGLSASASGSLSGYNGGSFRGQAGADASLASMGSGGGGGSSGSAQAQISGSLGGGSGGGSGPAGGSIISGSENSGGASGSAGGSASLGTVASPGSAQSYAPSTPKPEGLFSKMKGMVKTSVETLTKDDHKEQQHQQQQQQHQQQIGSVSMTAGASLGSGESGGQKSGGLMDKLGDVAKKGKEMVKETAKEVKDDVKSILKPGDGMGGASASGTVKLGSASADAKIHMGGGGSSVGGAADAKVHMSGNANGGADAKVHMSGGGASGGADAKVHMSGGGAGGGAEAKVHMSGSGAGGGADAKVHISTGKEGPLAKLMSKGQEMVHKIESKASEIGKEITKPLTGSVKADAQLKIGGASASAKAQIGPVKGPEKGLAVEMLDKVHEISRAPVEHAMKPIDKALGYKEDPLVKVMDQTEDMLRKPVSELAKPVESMLTGAFHTSEEAKAMASEQERREARLREEKARKEGRSVLGQITDKTVELAEKPFEIILKPFDRALGLSKKGEKNPLIKLIDQIYGFSKRPIDAVSRPFEKILRQMADGEQAYQVSVRFANSNTDPKLFTRLADGALNIADRVVTRPLEFVMRPLGYDQKNKKNPIVDAAHSLKNATRIGFELFTKPIDRIIKEIAEIGDIKDDAERAAEIQRRRQEASRIVAALDKLHEVAQQPFEIVLKPVGRVLGYNKEGKKEPLLRAWTFLHQVAMTPLQVVSKPLEDALLGERKRSNKVNVKGELKLGQAKVTAKASVGGAQGGATAAVSTSQGEKRKNFFVESIKKVEKFATKPIEVITSPIRKLILGEEDKIGAGKGFQAKAKIGPIQASANIQTGSGMRDTQPDKIVKTLEKINNVVLRPLEVMTQPISDMVSTDDGKLKSKIDVKVQGSSQMRGQSEKAQASMSASSGASKISASGSVSGPGAGQAQASGSLATPAGTISGAASAQG